MLVHIYANGRGAQCIMPAVIESSLAAKYIGQISRNAQATLSNRKLIAGDTWVNKIVAELKGRRALYLRRSRLKITFTS